MEALNFFGICIAFVVGCIFGLTLMYVGGLIIDRWVDSLTPDEILEIIREEENAHERDC